MDTEHDVDMHDGVPLERPGDLLARIRQDKGLSIADIAEQSRISIRQLEAIERNDFAALPSGAYAVGFSRTYARCLGLDEKAVAEAVREELGGGGRSGAYQPFEPVDPARIPPRWLAWGAAIIALLLAVGYGVWRAQLNRSPTDMELTQAQTVPQEQPHSVAAPVAPPAPATNPVVLTALTDVWVRIYDQAGQKLLEKELLKGESYTVPADANNPMIMTGRPDALAVTVAGQAVAPLGDAKKSISDVPVSGEALLARAVPAPAAATTAVPSATPAASASSPTAGGTAPTATAPVTRLQLRMPSVSRERNASGDSAALSPAGAAGATASEAGSAQPSTPNP